MMSENTGFGPGVTKAQLLRLVTNYRTKIKKVRKGGSTPQDHDHKTDTNSIWFSREAVEELFKVNDADGLRIYFGVHDTAVMPTPFDDQLTVVLVATKNLKGANNDMLSDSDDSVEKSASGSGGGGLPPGSGLNHGTICPPADCP